LQPHAAAPHEERQLETRGRALHEGHGSVLIRRIDQQDPIPRKEENLKIADGVVVHVEGSILLLSLAVEDMTTLSASQQVVKRDPPALSLFATPLGRSPTR
jgi:hypothetical protein